MALYLATFVLSTFSLLSVVDADVVHTTKLIWKYRHLISEFVRIKRHVTTLNQRFLLTFKCVRPCPLLHFILLLHRYLNNTPYTLTEAPWDTYADIQATLTTEWPYLVRLDDTTRAQQTISNPDGQNPSQVTNFSSYSYVGALKETEIRDYVFAETVRGNYAFGNHGPRMLGGNNCWLSRLEDRLAAFTGREACICFSSGFLACKTAIQAIADRGDVIFGDSRLHESIRDGIRASKQKGCKSYSFRHNDYGQLEQLLRRYRDEAKRAYIVIESVYSMDGDYADVVECKRLADLYDARIILDEAHGLGILGRTGRGIEELQACRGAAWLVIGSLTKAFGSVGGYACGSKKIIGFLHFFATGACGPSRGDTTNRMRCAGTMFSAPMSVPQAIAAYKTVDMIDAHPEWLDETRENMAVLTDLLVPLGKKHGVSVQTAPGSPLIAVIMNDFPSIRVLQVANKMRQKGFYVAAVNPPACPLREPRLRVTAPRGIGLDQIAAFAKALDESFTETAGIVHPVPIEDLANLQDLMG